MAYFIDQPQSRSAMLGQSIGGGLASGLGGVASTLVNQKLNQLAQRSGQQQAKQFAQSVGFTPKMAEAYSLLGPEGWKQVGPALLLGMQQEDTAPMEQLIGGFAPQQGTQLQQQGQMQQPQQQIPPQPGLQLSGKNKIAEAVERGREVLNPQLGIARERLKQSERKATAAEKLAEQKLEAGVRKENKAYYEETLKSEIAAKETKQIVDKMEKLIDNKKLPPAAFYKFIKDIQEDVSISSGATAGGAIGAAVGSLAGGAGAAPGALIGAGIGAIIKPITSLVESGIKYTYPDTEQFEKLSASMIRGAKEIFGSRITDADLRAFMQTVPNLTQTENGRRQIINNIRAVSEASKVRGNALKEIIKENKGKFPENLPLLVEERSSKELDSLAQKFING